MTQENMLARYSILHELGRGALGCVYAARNRETGTVIALKRLDPALLGKSGAGAAERFLKQARSARLLEHGNIVKVHDAGEVGGIVYVAMEMLEGENLRKILDAGPLPVTRAIQIVRDIASGLAYAHLQGVVHGGIKASNILVLPSGAVKVTDFGIAQPAQACPEQRRGEPLDHRSDVFSLGALFYEMLAHRTPSEGDAKPPAPSELNPHVPRALDALVLSMLAAQPGARMAGLPILLRELQRVEEGLGLASGVSTEAPEPAATVPPVDIPRSNQENAREAFDYQKAMVIMDRESRRERSSGWRHGMLGSLAILLAVLGIGFAGFMYYSPRHSERSIVATRAQEAPTTVPAVQPRPLAQTETPAPPAAEQPVSAKAPAPVAEATKEATVLSAATALPSTAPAAEPSLPAQTEAPAALASEQSASAKTAYVKASPQAAEPSIDETLIARAAEQQPGGTARLILAVSPRGEIYIDGKHHGTTPPVTTFDLEPGMHRIEVRSGSRTPYLTYMTVQAGDVRRIRHDFDTSRAVYPRKSASWQNRSRAAR